MIGLWFEFFYCAVTRADKGHAHVRLAFANFGLRLAQKFSCSVSAAFEFSLKIQQLSIGTRIACSFLFLSGVVPKEKEESSHDESHNCSSDTDGHGPDCDRAAYDKAHTGVTYRTAIFRF